MSEVPSERKAAKITAAASNNVNIGAKVATANYKIHLPTKGANVVNIIDKTRGAVRHGKTVGEWIVRVDGPHKGANFNHININPSVSRMPDPHYPISGATLDVCICIFFNFIHTFHLLWYYEVILFFKYY